MTDIERALLNPTGVFNTPEEVLEVKNLSKAQKIKILRSWEYDARELLVAEEENMAMVDPQINMLDRIINALRELDAKLNPESSPPTKHGGSGVDKPN